MNGRDGRRSLSARQRFAVLAACGFACAYCGARPPDVELVIDHVHPVADGGATDPANLVAACVACNNGKSDGRLASHLLPRITKAVEWPKRARARARIVVPKSSYKVRCDYCGYFSRRIGLDIGPDHLGGRLPICEQRPCCDLAGDEDHLHSWDLRTLEIADLAERDTNCIAHQTATIPLACVSEGCGTSYWYEVSRIAADDCDTAIHLLRSKYWMSCRRDEIRSAFARAGVILPADGLWKYPVVTTGYHAETEGAA